MSKTELGFAVVLGSTRPNRFGPTVARWFEEQLVGRSRYVLLDLANLDIADPHFSETIAAADGVVIITPEYNHSFPGPLKAAIDSLREEWAAKAVGFVSYGGISGGLRAVEALRLVFAELHAVTIRETVSFAMAWEQFDEHGNLKNPEIAETAACRFLDQMTWWAHALRAGRSTGPYAA